ncbi:amidohydrolase [Flagellimonas zhangzhouensis]|uniref:Aminobenzoyl-glutamate utilization protein B n=1 Tax=Flagellimonas zhangzhouensis TaxID=1073328 RepID=A0A1H2SZR4_9FLAO|nr:amidohydrolase [Allomuricauda zhangzhouensis]SDQ81174.1 aminobenzoyl-glutamate utilization protein B [Allomuricauda zhangzhouensis]SDW36529.1 aminobenzoyl-glutamate utilization protein B [Allomuricauda zhangzhouensis]
MLKSTSTLLVLLLCLSNLQAQKSKKDVLKKLDEQAAAYGEISQEIWELAEVGYQEEKSSALLQKTLQDAGFTIKAGIAGIPTAFVAEFGIDGPVLAVLGEFDALPGLSQQAVPEKKPAGGIAGHACGHNLFGTASVAAAIAVKDWLQATNTKGKIRFYGTPAEEGGSGKVYMVREGVFDDVDVALHWHPGDSNNANPFTSMANKSAKFRFTGISAHAAGAPERGRSALDGVESMDLMVNMMREHIPQDARIHYVITSGGKAPNVVPDYAEVYYYARHFNRNVVIDVFDRIVKAAEGAALGTGTTMEYEMIGGTYELLPNLTLQEVMYDNLVEVGGFDYSEEENVFGEQIVKSLGMETIDASKNETIQPYKTGTKINGSTDIGDVSFVVPTIGMIAATFVPGTPGHSWQAVAAGGTSIGKKGMMVAAKTIALTAIDIYKDQKLIEKAKIEFEEKRGKDFKYVPLLGNRPPALDYRK